MADKTYIAPIDKSERVLSDGRVAIPGVPLDLDDDAQADEHNARLIDEGQLLELPSAGGQSVGTQSAQTEDGGEV